MENTKKTYVALSGGHRYVDTSQSQDEEYTNKLVSSCKTWVNEIIQKANLTPLSEEILNTYVCLSSCNGLENYKEVSYIKSSISYQFISKDGFKNILLDERQEKIEDIEKKGRLKYNYRHYLNMCFFVDIINKETGLNKIVPLTYRSLCHLVNLIFTDIFINNEKKELEVGYKVINDEDSYETIYFKKADLLYLNDIYDYSSTKHIDETFKNLLTIFNIKRQEDVKNILVNKIVDIGVIDTRHIEIKNNYNDSLDTCNEENKLLSFDKSLGLHDKFEISLSEVNNLSDELLSIIENGYEAFKTIRYINTIEADYENQERITRGSYDGNHIMYYTNMFYCKHCNKNSVVPKVFLSKNDYINTVTCPICEKEHVIGNCDSVNKLTFLNATVFDEIETENKIKFRSRVSQYTHSQRGIYYESYVYGFTYNLATNRAYVYFSKNNKKGHVTDISAVKLQELSNTPLLMSNETLIDKNGKNVSRIEKLKECFNNVYDLLSSKIDIKFTKEEIMEIAKVNLKKTDPFLFRNTNDEDEEYGEYSNKVREHIYLASMKVLGEVLKDKSKSREYLEVLPICNNPIVTYIKKASTKNGRYLTNKFGMSNATRKAIIKKPWKILNYILFKDAIKDTNNMLKLFDLEITNNIVENFIFDFQQGVDSKWNQNLKFIDNISSKFAELVKPLKYLYKSETSFVNRLITNNVEDINNYLYDTCIMLDRVLSENVDFNFSSKFKLKRLHDELSSANRKIRKRNKTIQYDGDEENLAYQDEEFKLCLARDTHTLIDIGVKLNICVGSYDQRALEKHCTILHVMDKTDSYKEVCCIEVRKSNSSITVGNDAIFNLIQTKTYSNSKPEGKLREFLLNWIKEYKITTTHTSDIRFEDNEMDEVAAELEINFPQRQLAIEPF